MSLKSKDETNFSDIKSLKECLTAFTTRNTKVFQADKMILDENVDLHEGMMNTGSDKHMG